jgi:hypothetical protein
LGRAAFWGEALRSDSVDYILRSNMHMDQKLKEFLQKLESDGLENDARVSERPRMMLNLEPASAQLLSILVRASGVKRALEIGTSNGYSTIWLAWSLADAGGRIFSIDRNPQKHELARENLRCAGFLDSVDLRARGHNRNCPRLGRPVRFGFSRCRPLEISGNHGDSAAKARSVGLADRR